MNICLLTKTTLAHGLGGVERLEVLAPVYRHVDINYVQVSVDTEVLY